jgi:retron-type reverse transcriptase
MRKYQVRFGGGQTEKEQQCHLAGWLPTFSDHSHGFRPGRGCHTALRDIYHTWVGTVWFIEGDISKCFDRLDHTIILSKLREHIKDERFIRLIAGLLKAGYLEEWTWNATYSGAPQGSIVSPILSNLYLDALDKFVETDLIPAYTKGTRRKFNPIYEQLRHSANYQARKGRKGQARALRKQMQRLPSIDPDDPDYRRLRYCRYADDVRHLTQYEILLAEKGGSEDDDLWVISPTWTRKPKGKGACEKRGKRVKALKRCPARPA